MEEEQPSMNLSEKIAFKAETHQIMDILIHSLYIDREVFLRELISNASDALTQMNFIMLTERDIRNPEAELKIEITCDEEKNLLIIEDTGIGMTREEMVTNLGTIAHSGAKAFLDAAQQDTTKISDIIGQFGVGFYSSFMVADSIQVISRSYREDAEAAQWVSDGKTDFTVLPVEKEERGTRIIVKLKEDAKEFAQDYRIRQIIQKHSDFIPFPIYFGKDHKQVNRVTSLWRQSPKEVDEKQYEEFYKQLTYDIEPPLAYIHLNIDAPVQMYAVLFIPSNPEKPVFSMRKDEGLKLYARKVLIQDYCKDLLPEFFRFVSGVVDSEDLPLNVSRETVQSNRLMGQLKKLLTNKVIDHLKVMRKDKPEKYEQFWVGFQRFLKEGIATSAEYTEALPGLTLFHTLNAPEKWTSLDDYITNKKIAQDKIYYILGERESTILHSPHLEQFRKHKYDVLLMSDAIDPFMLLRLNKYKDLDLVNVSSEKLELPEAKAEQAEEKDKTEKEQSDQSLIERFKKILGDKVEDVRTTEILVDSPVRLVEKEGELNPEMQRVYRYIDKKFEAPKRILEINTDHALINGLATLDENDTRNTIIIEQLFEDALLIEGLNPDPASMVERINRIMLLSMEKKD